MWADFLRTITPNNKTAKALETQGRSGVPERLVIRITTRVFLIATTQTCAPTRRPRTRRRLVRPYAITVPMGMLTAQWPIVDETTHSGGVSGGISASGSTRAGFAGRRRPRSGCQLRARQLALCTRIPNVLMADAPMLSVDQPELPGRCAGRGPGFHQGQRRRQATRFLNFFTCAIEVAKRPASRPTRSSGRTSSGVLRMTPAALMRGGWMANLDTLPELMTMAVRRHRGSLVGWGCRRAGDAPPVRITARSSSPGRCRPSATPVTSRSGP